MTRGVRIVNPDERRHVAAMARLAAAVEAKGRQDRRRPRLPGQKPGEGRRAAESRRSSAEGENGDGEAIEAELAGVE